MPIDFTQRYGSVVRIAADQANRQYFQPDVAALEKDRDPVWFADNIKYICTFYDQWYNIVSANGAMSSGIAGGTASTSWGVPGETPVQRMIRMMTYYNGRQPNLNYNHLDKNVNTSNMMPDWIRSQKVYSVVNVMKDVMAQMMANVGFDVENMTEEVMTEKKQMLDKLMIQHELKDQFRNVANMGVNVDSGNGKQFEMPEDVQRFITEDYKDFDSEILVKIANHIWSCYDYKDSFLQMWMHTRTAGRCGFEHQVVNGKYKPKVWMPYELIVDNRRDDEFNRYALFAGVVKFYTPVQAYTLCPELLDYKDEINKMAQETSLGNSYNTMNNLAGWYYPGGNQRGMMSAVTGYWKTLRFTGKKRFEGKYGNTLIRNTQGFEAGDDQIEDICQATIWGNRFLTDYGYRNNVQENFYDKSKVELPIKVFMPNMQLGESVSITERISNLVDEYDAMRFKIREMVGKQKGRVFFIKGWKFGNSTNQKIINQDLSTIGFHVLTHSGEPEDFKDDEGNVMESVDMTLDPNIDKLQGILNTISQEILEVGKISLTSLGNDQVQKYMGLGVQQGALAGGSGTSSDYTQFMNYLQNNVQYATDLNKYLLTEDADGRAEMIVGKRGVEYLRLEKKLRYSNGLLSVVVSPFITSEVRGRLLTMADRMASQDQLDYLDYLEIEMATSVPELYRNIRWGIKKKENKNEHEQAVQQALQQLADQNKQLMAEILQMQREQGMNQRQSQAEDHKTGSQVLDMAAQQQQGQQQVAA